MVFAIAHTLALLTGKLICFWISKTRSQLGRVALKLLKAVLCGIASEPGVLSKWKPTNRNDSVSLTNPKHKTIMNETLQRLYKADREDGFELNLALDAIGFFVLGHKEGNAFHEGLYRTNQCAREKEEAIEVFCSQYLLDRESEIPEKASELHAFACAFSDEINKLIAL